MNNVLVDLFTLILKACPFLFSLILWTIVSITFSKAIKKHAKVLYWISGTLSFLFFLNYVAGSVLPFKIFSIPILGSIISEFSRAANVIHPLLVIIMFMGAFSTKHKTIGKLMSIRKELAIFVGFPLLAHIVKRLTHSFLGACHFFLNYTERINHPIVLSKTGAIIQNSVYVLGVVMTVFVLILWITSFTSVRQKMGAAKWKRWQTRFSYPLYAMLFIHSTGLAVNEVMWNKALEDKLGLTLYVESSVEAKYSGQNELLEGFRDIVMHHLKESEKAKKEGKPVDNNAMMEEIKNEIAAKAKDSSKEQEEEASESFELSEIKISVKNHAQISIVVYILIYGSYLFFRLRKAKSDKLRKKGI